MNIFVAGNGVSLGRYPMGYLSRLPLFALNYYPMHIMDVWPSPAYWTAWDADPMLPILPILPDTCQPILHKKDRPYIEKNLPGMVDRIQWWRCDRHIPGFGWDEADGTLFVSSIHWAVCISIDVLKASGVFVVGFDCTTGDRVSDNQGRGSNRHFYDREPGKIPVRYAQKWDQQMYELARFYRSLGKGVLNVNPWSKARKFSPRGLI